MSDTTRLGAVIAFISRMEEVITNAGTSREAMNIIEREFSGKDCTGATIAPLSPTEQKMLAMFCGKFSSPARHCWWLGGKNYNDFLEYRWHLRHGKSDRASVEEIVTAKYPKSESGEWSVADPADGITDDLPW